jgi:XTP/dITP diphosphohydrolase
MKRLVLASGNPGKIGEIAALLAPLGIEVLPQSQLGIAEADEPHDTFLENALAKARHASRDSGLCVPALGGEPGVNSAYYAGREGNREQRDSRNNQRLLRELKDDRRAYYACIMVLTRSATDPLPLIADGIWHGEIARAPRGANGFGYDPLFFLKEHNRTAAELEPAQKNRISHRGQALTRLMELLRDPGRA